MTTLVIGGTGKTGAPLSKLLHAANLPFLIASRSGKAPEPYKAVTNANIDRMYIIGPARVYEPFPIVKPFIDLARSKGVKRFVLLSTSQDEAGDPLQGALHQYLIDIRVEYTVLRPSWFQQNFGDILTAGIRDGNQTVSATGDGRTLFVSTEDIAEVAFGALTAEPSLNKDILIFGPELFSNDDVAELFSSILGRKITHQKIPIEALEKTFLGIGLSQQYAQVLGKFETNVSNGLEEEKFKSSVDKVIGKHTMEEYIRANRDLWVKQ
ncbi:NAD(P)-binding protein [Pholiota conissans]|uniref:NAD(P)-binding protein n=1 Tax=Pholiota conissans TaxID=109636 RepID=A0A9P6CVK3_9AGAR|nr:NAD(P)-binding protein [Pholiota conissans]